MRSNTKSILERWQLTENELTYIIDTNPSLRGFILGYIGEYKVRSIFLADERILELEKPDDHDRKSGSKNDMIFEYRGYNFSIEVKSLQTNSIKHNLLTGILTGHVQVDASDRRSVIFDDGTTIETTCLLRGQFDILAINLFQFREKWDFGFILNRDLPSSKSKKYTPYQQSQLLSTTVKVTFPLESPFEVDPFILLDQLVDERTSPT